jgi:hypothetical protein
MGLRLLFVSALLSVSACAPPASTSSDPILYVYRLDPPSFLQLDGARQPVREIPFAAPDGCDVRGVHAAPRGPRLAIELGCAFGPAVLWLDVQTATVRQPITGSDSHFLAWAADGQSVYLRIDSINRPRLVRVGLDGGIDPLPISELTYDLAPSPSGDVFLFAYSNGMGLGSELWRMQSNGSAARQVLADPDNYLALTRWSPDGGRLAFIRIPDSATPFTQGELWVMKADGTQARWLAAADAGHGFAPAWSPDGTRIAFVTRENAGEPAADASSDALVSDVRVVDLDGDDAGLLTELSGARVEAPVWVPDADVVLFSARLDDRMAVYVADLIAGSLQPIPIESICCAAWLRE